MTRTLASHLDELDAQAAADGRAQEDEAIAAETFAHEQRRRELRAKYPGAANVADISAVIAEALADADLPF